MDTNAHKQSQPSQPKLVHSHQCHTCWTFPRGCETCAAMPCDYDLWEPKTQDTKKIFWLPGKRAKPRDNFITRTFGKSLFITLYQMRYVIYIPLNTKDLTIKLTMVAYRHSATKFARTNNSDLLRALKHLLETRLYNWPLCLRPSWRLCQFTDILVCSSIWKDNFLNWFYTCVLFIY